MKLINRIALVWMLTTILCLAITNTAFAHKMLIEPIEDGKIRVIYGDGTLSTTSQVTVLGENKDLITSGSVDEEGCFYYPLHAVFIEANDGMGHRAKWKVGDPMKSGTPTAVKIVLPLLFFVGVAWYYYRKHNKVIIDKKLERS